MSGNLENLMNKLLVSKRKFGIFGIFSASIRDNSISESYIAIEIILFSGSQCLYLLSTGFYVTVLKQSHAAPGEKVSGLEEFI